MDSFLLPRPVALPGVAFTSSVTSLFDQAAEIARLRRELDRTRMERDEKGLAEPGTGHFCHGDTPGMVAICLASIIVVVRIFGIMIPGIPTVDRIIAKCETLPAFIQADPMKQAGAPG